MDIKPSTEHFDHDVIFFTGLITVPDFAWSHGIAYIENDAYEWVETEVTPAMQSLIDRRHDNDILQAALARLKGKPDVWSQEAAAWIQNYFDLKITLNECLGGLYFVNTLAKTCGVNI